MRSGGVRSSTSRTNPGLGIVGSVLSGVEGDSERSEPSGGERVVERLAPAAEGVGHADDAVDRRLGCDVGREIERAALQVAVWNRLDAAGVGADELELAVPQRRQV